MPKKVFIYCLKDPTTGDVRYIGQTNNLKKRFQSHLNSSIKTKTHLGNWLRSLSKPPVLVVLHEVVENESWHEEERRYISCARAIGMRLVNGTDGGDGTSGPQSPEHSAAISAALRGVPKSPEHRAATSAAKKGVRLSPEHCAAMRGPKSPEACAAMSAAKKGVPRGPHSPEHRAAISAAKKGVRLSPEHCAATSAGRKGLPWSPARRAAYERRWGS